MNRTDLIRNHTGAAVAEFALVLPLFLTLLLGITAYGGYFWRAHALQEVADGAARAAIAGLTAAERRQLVDTAIAAHLPSLGGIAAGRAQTSVTDTGSSLTVELTYDAGNDLLVGSGLVPLPNAVIRRRSVIRLAGL